MIQVTFIVGLTLWSCSSAAVTTARPHSHFLQVLMVMHKSETFNLLPESEKVMFTELVGAAETNTLTQYIDSISFERLLIFLDHITRINPAEAKYIEDYIYQELNKESSHHHRKRSLAEVLGAAVGSQSYKNLTSEEKHLMVDLLQAAESFTVTQFIHREGYAKIVKLIEDLVSPAETHLFLMYLIQHINAEAAMAGSTTPSLIPIG